MEVADGAREDGFRYKTQCTVTRRNAVGGNFANFAELHEARCAATTVRPITISMSMEQ